MRSRRSFARLTVRALHSGGRISAQLHTPSPRVSPVFALLRYWGYRSDLHHRKSALPKWDGGEQPARDFSVLRCVDVSHPPGCSACAPAPSVNDAASLRLGDGGYQLKLLLLGTPEYASMRDRRRSAFALVCSPKPVV